MSASLREVQSRFARTIMEPRPLAELVREDDVADLVTASARQTRLERLDVYHSGYRARLVECLADDYPAMAYAMSGMHAMREGAFEALCHEYIATHPSRSPSLNRFGRHMAPFVLGRGGAHAGFLRDLAVLEWAIVEAIHAAPVEAIDLEALQNVPIEQWAGARFAPSGAASLIDFDYPVNRFFQAFKEDQAPAIPSAEGTTTAVYRRGWFVWRMDVAPPMRALLESLFAGVPLGEALDRVASHVESPEDVMLTFREWVAGGFFGRIDLEP
jgi:hypothetical protein